MAFFRSLGGGGDPGPVIRTEGLYLRQPVVGDYAQWAVLREASRAFLEPWEPRWPKDDLERAAYRRRIKRYQREVREDQGYPFFLFGADDDRLLGGLTLSYIRRGVTQSCSLGYWMGAPYAGKGHMSRAVQAVIPFVFGTLRLHRIDAACLPSNQASIRLLEKAGFTREGFARRYLCIAGEWRDHYLYALLSDDPAGQSAVDTRADQRNLVEKV